MFRCQVSAELVQSVLSFLRAATGDFFHAGGKVEENFSRVIVFISTHRGLSSDVNLALQMRELIVSVKNALACSHLNSQLMYAYHRKCVEPGDIGLYFPIRNASCSMMDL